MVEIIPAILVKSEAEFHSQLNSVEPYVDWVQLDVVDGEFAPNITWGDAQTVRTLSTNVKFEIDLMVNNVGIVAGEWALPASPVGRIYFHSEVAGGLEDSLITKIQKAGIEVGMSLVPETPLDNVLPFLTRIDAVLLLGVSPGFQGQQLQESVIDNVCAIRAQDSGIAIEVDGGVNADTIGRLVEAGVTRVAVGSYIFTHPEGPSAAIEELKIKAEASVHA